MSSQQSLAEPVPASIRTDETVYAIIAAISVSHMLNDMIQSLLPAIYPMLKTDFSLSFAQIGLITLAFQLTASLLQPIVGLYTDRGRSRIRWPSAWASRLVGLVLLSVARRLSVLLLAARAGRHRLLGLPPGIVARRPHGVGRAARASPSRLPGRRQCRHRRSGRCSPRSSSCRAASAAIAWFSILALLGDRRALQCRRAGTREHRRRTLGGGATARGRRDRPVARRGHRWRSPSSIALIFSKYVYLASLTSYYTFYLIDRFGVSVQASQLYLFVFLGAVAAGTVIGGPVGDRFGRKYVIWGSILGVLPFTLALPYANLFWTGVLTVVDRLHPRLGLLGDRRLCPGAGARPRRHGLRACSSASPSASAGSARPLLGELADRTSIEFVYRVCSFLPAIGLLTVFLPNIEGRTRTAR